MVNANASYKLKLDAREKRGNAENSLQASARMANENAYKLRNLD